MKTTKPTWPNMNITYPKLTSNETDPRIFRETVEFFESKNRAPNPATSMPKKRTT